MSRRFQCLLLLVTVGITSINKAHAMESSWTSAFNNYYLSSIETLPWGLVAGEFDSRIWAFPYNGIYITKDLGNTWENFGLKEKGITDIKYNKETIYATTYYHTTTPAGLYKSNDMGITWEHIGPTYSSNKVEVLDNIIILGTFSHGIYVSQDTGITWEQKTPEVYITELTIEKDKILANSPTQAFISLDKGTTWEKIPYEKIIKRQTFKTHTYTIKNETLYEGENIMNIDKKVQDISITHTTPPYLYAVVNGEGIHRYEIPQIKLAKDPFLHIPWKYENDNELLDLITAYFDHEYPLLGYNLKENDESKQTTVNFFGIKEYPPQMYYSSHNGTDYSLPKGTPLHAPAEGTARYFWCETCGNSIEIDHQNGYKTIYMHLQNDIGIDKTNLTDVIQGQYIGKVGLTGNTTGAHLHMTVTKDNIVIDPYGWKNPEYQDPWEIYENTGIKGTQSKYLWKDDIHEITGFITDNTANTITLENKEVSFENIATPLGYTIKLSNYIKPNIQDNLLQYIKNTSMLLEATDLLGNAITNLPSEVKIIFNLGKYIPTKNTKVYVLNEEFNLWEPLETFMDIASNTVYAYTPHFSQFAVFEQIDYSKGTLTDKATVKNVTTNLIY